MKNNQATFLLVGMLFISTLIAVAMLFLYNRYGRAVADFEPRATQAAAHWQQAMQTMAGDVVEYSKKNPAIEPTMRSAGIIVNSNAAPAAATKQGNK